MSDILESPPEDEGDNSVAGGGDAAEPLSEDDLSDTDELDDEDDDGADS